MDHQQRFAPATAAKLGSPKKGVSFEDKAFTEWLAQCPKMELSSWVRACMGQGSLPAAPWALKDGPMTPKDFVQILCAIGAFEPLGAIRPGACDVVSVYEKFVTVPPATINAAGEVVPSTEVLVKFCAPGYRGMVIERLRGEPANLTAAESGEVFSKITQVQGFSEGYCPPGEPSPGEDIGTFNNVEHLVLCAGAGFDLNARNHSPFSPAVFHVTGRAWSTC